MIEIVLCFFCASVVLYAVLGGADYGAGIIELLSTGSKKATTERTISHALAPVWEANHVWLILALVILFTAFPTVFHAFSVAFHVPLTLMLVGVVFRGCAFTFRHYDESGERTHLWYSRLFQFGSVTSPLMQGMIAGAVLLGRASPDSGTFAERFLNPWLNPFCMSVGLFTCVLDVLLASVFLVGETKNAKLQDYFVARVGGATMLVLGLTPIVFAAAAYTGLPLFHYFWSDSLCLFIMALAGGLLLFMTRLARHPNILVGRTAVSMFVVLVLLGFCRVHFPHFPAPHGARSMASWAAGAAPEATLRSLLVALVAGMLIVLPAMYSLMKTFKSSSRVR